MKSRVLILAMATAALSFGLPSVLQAQQQVRENGEARDGVFRGRAEAGERGGMRAGARGEGMRGGMMAPRPGGRGAPPLARLDANGDGSIDLDEFLGGREGNEERALMRLDTDADGLLSREELEARPERQRPGPDRAAMRECLQDARPDADPGFDLAERFDTLDTNDDGKLDTDELAAARVARATDTFGRLDANGDGVLVAEELQAARADMREQTRELRGELRECMQTTRAAATP